jgi:4-hydroxy-tetrahydrodipicolinate reductase
MIKIILNGCNGRMGKTISELAKSYDSLKIVAGIDKFLTETNSYFPTYDDINNFQGECDVVLDFSSPKSLPSLSNYCIDKKLPLVLCTTGYSDEEYKAIETLSKQIPVFNSGNMSLGINIVSSILKKISPVLFNGFDIEVIEKHHNQKVDSPSGTALMLADSIKSSLEEKVQYVHGREGLKKREKSEIGIHAVRGGSIVGEHEVIFAGKGETIEIKHTALSRDVFASGALRACEFMNGKTPGFYNMDNVING